jgi:hypothetical protein
MSVVFVSGCDDSIDNGNGDAVRRAAILPDMILSAIGIPGLQRLEERVRLGNENYRAILQHVQKFSRGTCSD